MMLIIEIQIHKQIIHNYIAMIAKVELQQTLPTTMYGYCLNMMHKAII